MSEFDRSKTLGKFLHQRREPVEPAPATSEFTTGAPEEDHSAPPTLGKRFKDFSAMKTKPQTPGEKAWSKEKADISAARNRESAGMIGRRG